MATNKEERKDIKAELLQVIYKLEILQSNYNNLTVEISKLQNNKDNSLWIFSIANFVINCIVAFLLYLNLHP